MSEKKPVDLLELAKKLNVGAKDLINVIKDIQLKSDVKIEHKQ